MIWSRAISQLLGAIKTLFTIGRHFSGALPRRLRSTQCDFGRLWRLWVAIMCVSKSVGGRCYFCPAQREWVGDATALQNRKVSLLRALRVCAFVGRSVWLLAGLPCKVTQSAFLCHLAAARSLGCTPSRAKSRVAALRIRADNLLPSGAVRFFQTMESSAQSCGMRPFIFGLQILGSGPYANYCGPIRADHDDPLYTVKIERQA
jgi:hypothetical protein